MPCACDPFLIKLKTMNILKFIYIPRFHFSIYNEYLNAYRKKINKIPFYIRRTGIPIERKNHFEEIKLGKILWNCSTHYCIALLYFFTCTEGRNTEAYKNNKNLVVTVIRKIKGNKEILKREIESICNTNVIEKTDCFLIKGNHKKKVKDYFKYIGY